MTAEEAVRSQLLATAGVSALVSGRVFQDRLPQSPTLPAIRVQLISDPEEAHLRGYTDLTRARVQIDCYAQTRADARSVGIAVMSALRPLPFTRDSIDVVHVRRIDRRSMFEAEELKLYRVFQDFWIWSKPSTN